MANKQAVEVSDGQANCISLKAVVDEKRSKVVFVESDDDFVDVLLSFLTIPVGTIITLARNQPLPLVMGCIKNVYESVENIDVQYFHLHSEAGKLMLLKPRNGAESFCKNLKLKIDSDAAETSKHFGCASQACTYKGHNLLSLYKEAVCKCGRPMDRKMELKEKTMTKTRGVFVNGMTRFAITDELQVVPMSTSASFSIFAKHGITDWSTLRDRAFNVGADEVLNLLICSLVSKTPLTEILLKNKSVPDMNCSSLYQGSSADQSQSKEDHPANPDGNIRVKLIVSKTKKMVCYAEAEKDFVNLLFSFLTIPLGYIAKKISDGSFRGCIDHLYKTAQDLDNQFFKSISHKEMLVNPRQGLGFSYRNDLLAVEEASYAPCYYAYWSGSQYYDHDHGGFCFSAILTTDRSQVPSQYEPPVSLTVIDPKSHYKDGNENVGGIVKGPTIMFMVTDSLIISPISSIACLSILKKLKVPFSDVEEKVVHVGKNEAVQLLLSSFFSTSALTDVFIKNIPK